MSIRILFEAVLVFDANSLSPENKDPLALAKSFNPLKEAIFAPFNPDLKLDCLVLENEVDLIALEWQIDLSDLPGLLHTPHYHEKFFMVLVHDLFPACKNIKIQIYRPAKVSEVIDHGQIYEFYGSDATPEDYPVFRPNLHSEVPDYDQVFMQDGIWYWTSSPIAKIKYPHSHDTPAAGPSPSEIWALWDQSFHDRYHAKRPVA